MVGKMFCKKEEVEYRKGNKGIRDRERWHGLRVESTFKLH